MVGEYKEIVANSNPELNWRPNSQPQMDFLSLPNEIFECLYGGAAGGGKAASLETPILTINGWKKLGEIKKGDFVYSSSGLPTQVIAESEIFTNHRCYELTFDEGSKIIADEDHQWITLNYNERAKNFKRTEEFRAKRRSKRPSRSTGKRPDLVGANSNRQFVDYLEPMPHSIRTTKEIRDSLYDRTRINHSVDVCKPLDCCISVPIDPYTLGAWLGDGHKASGQITNHETDVFILNRIRLNHPVYDHQKSISHWIANFNPILKKNNLFNNKHIPDVYYSADYDTRLALLQGLMDTDGYCAVDGQCEIALSLPRLAEDVFSLICSLGIKAYKTVNSAFLYGIQKEDRTRIKFTTEIPVFSLPRKLERQKLFTDSRNKVRYIVDVKEIPTEPVKCIQVQGGTFLIGRALIPTHNSELLLRDPIVKGFHLNPRFHGIIFRRTFPQLEESLIPRAWEIYPHCGAKYNETKHLWTFPSGAKIRFGYMVRDVDAREHDTAEYNYIGWDELTHMSEYQYKRLISRCRTSSNLPAYMRAASNPGNIGNAWVRARFIEPYGGIYDGRMIFDTAMKTYRNFIPAKLTDNIDLCKNDPGYINRLRALPVSEQKALIDGDWWAFSGQVFSEFRERPYSDEPAIAQHVIYPDKSGNYMPIPEFWPKVVSIDWGYTAKTAVYWYAISPDSRVFIYREYTCEKKDISEWGADIRRLSQFDGNIVETVIDPSANQNRGQGKSIKDQVIEATGWNLSDADNDRIGGKMLVHEYLRWTELPAKYVPSEGRTQEKYDYILRNHGLKAANQYDELFFPDPPETNLPKLQIFSSCVDLISTIPNCAYKEDKEGVKAEDVADFNGDDPYDSLRYGLKACYKYVHQSIREFRKFSELAKIQESFEQTGDYNALARKAFKMGKENRSSGVPRRSKIWRNSYRPGTSKSEPKYRETFH